LLDVDVCDGRGVDVFLYIEGDGAIYDGFTGEPGDALL
jgi:hypothetical protein